MNNQDLVKQAAYKIAAVNWGQVGTGVMQGLGVGLGIIGITATAEIISDKVKEMIQERKSAQYFQQMLDAHPSLQKEDPNEIAKYWASLYHFAPQMAQDPLASGAYIKQSIARLSAEQFGGPPPETFKTLVEIQKQYREGRSENKKDSRMSAVQQALLSNAIGNAMSNNP